jgi:hypothetical protein
MGTRRRYLPRAVFTRLYIVKAIYKNRPNLLLRAATWGRGFCERPNRADYQWGKDPLDQSMVGLAAVRRPTPSQCSSHLYRRRGGSDRFRPSRNSHRKEHVC